ncbi:class I SAM-dependent methyltransferase [Pedobacter agri]|uniref:Methyltransferase domain-containing protein n=1 Tax=Pedobacter agri TaxID=454586 RepID=A0A9X3D9T6_9SPHI|nr:methyltransferase domain-containing protein [Pedobacter agri]MCX3263633.1 methyltransferase domain-containing protein [Pedobacter agri]
MHLNSELLFRKYALIYFQSNLKILEIGPAGFPSAYQKIVNNDNITWHTADFSNTSYIENAASHLTYQINSPYKFPINDESYDVIISGQVIEHVGQVWKWIDELVRITRPKGKIITINPVSWPYHEAPIDCWRIFPDGITALAEMKGLTVNKCLFESLEIDDILKYDSKSTFIPGRSYNYENSLKDLKKRIYFNKIIRHVPFLKSLEQPIEVSFDTISILEK